MAVAAMAAATEAETMAEAEMTGCTSRSGASSGPQAGGDGSSPGAQFRFLPPLVYKLLMKPLRTLTGWGGC